MRSFRTSALQGGEHVSQPVKSLYWLTVDEFLKEVADA